MVHPEDHRSEIDFLIFFFGILSIIKYTTRHTRYYRSRRGPGDRMQGWLDKVHSEKMLKDPRDKIDDHGLDKKPQGESHDEDRRVQSEANGV
jgi:hypothetical protein